MDINRVILIGRLVRDPETRIVQGGTTVTRMRIAVNRLPSRSGESQADFIDVVAWRQLGEVCGKVLRKGSRIAIEGSLRQRSWQDKDGNYQNRVEVEASKVQFLDPKGSAQQQDLGVAEEVYAQTDEQDFSAINDSSGYENSISEVEDFDFDIEDFTFEGGDSE